ncbi:unnamed protein product, partial [Tilletia caries]
MKESEPADQGTDDAEECSEPGVILFQEDDEARDEDGWLDEDEDSEGLNSNNMTDEDDETPLMCNGVAHKAPAAKPIVTRESNVSNAKAPFGDASKVSEHRPPLVHPIVAKIKINGYEAKAL